MRLKNNRNIGTLIVLGYTETAITELNQAKLLRPNHNIMAVDYAVCLEECDMVYVGHVDDYNIVEHVHKSVWGSQIEIAVGVVRGSLKGFVSNSNDYTDLGLVGLEVFSPGLDAPLHMLANPDVYGYTEVILCGCPLDGTPLDPTYRKIKSASMGINSEDLFFGEGTDFSSDLYFLEQKMSEDVDGIFNNLFSMGGYTKKIFGEPAPNG